MPIPTKTPTVAEYLEYWLAEVIKPNREEAPTRTTSCCPGFTSFPVSETAD